MTLPVFQCWLTPRGLVCVFISLSQPWPSVYFSIIGALSFINLNFRQFPVVSCVNQRTPVFEFFEAITGALMGFLVLILATWLLGRRYLARKKASDEEILNFSRRTVSKLISIAMLSYAPICQIIVQMFSCKNVGFDYYLTADLSQKCYVDAHYRAMKLAVRFLGLQVVEERGEQRGAWDGATCSTKFSHSPLLVSATQGFWVVVFPFGVPALCLVLLYRFKVPQLAVMKRQSAILQAVVIAAKHEEWLPQETPVNNRLTVETITDEVLDVVFFRFCVDRIRKLKEEHARIARRGSFLGASIRPTGDEVESMMAYNDEDDEDLEASMRVGETNSPVSKSHASSPGAVGPAKEASSQPPSSRRGGASSGAHGPPAEASGDDLSRSAAVLAASGQVIRGALKHHDNAVFTGPGPAPADASPSWGPESGGTAGGGGSTPQGFQRAHVHQNAEFSDRGIKGGGKAPTRGEGSHIGFLAEDASPGGRRQSAELEGREEASLPGVVEHGEAPEVPSTPTTGVRAARVGVEPNSLLSGDASVAAVGERSERGSRRGGEGGHLHRLGDGLSKSGRRAAKSGRKAVQATSAAIRLALVKPSRAVRTRSEVTQFPRDYKIAKVLEFGELTLRVPPTNWTPSDPINVMEIVALDAVGNLFMHNHVSVWYWEVLWLVEKLVLTTLLAFINPGSALQARAQCYP